MGPVILLRLAQGTGMLLSDVMWVISRSEADVFLCFRDKSLRQLRRRTRGRHRPCKVNIKCVSDEFDLFFLSVLMVVVEVEVCFLSELEQNVEQSKKDYETLKEERESREKELTEVRSHMRSTSVSDYKIIKATDKRYLSHIYSANFNAKLKCI